MKTLKLITCIILMCAGSIFAQTPVPATTPAATPAPAPEKKALPARPMPGETLNQPGQQPMVQGQPGGMRASRYMVQIPHTKEQCEKVMNEMKGKGSQMLIMRFDWGCAAGQHVGYAVLPGPTEDAVRKQLPEGVQKTAVITKVEKHNMGQMEQMHK